MGPFCNYQFDAFDSWWLHESEIQIQGNQRFFSFLPLRDLSSPLRSSLVALEPEGGSEGEGFDFS